MPRFSMLVPPRPRMTPSMIFSSKVLSSSSSPSAARTGPAAIARPMPNATLASHRPRASRCQEVRTFHPLASVSRIALFLFNNIGGRQTGARHQLQRPYRPGSGRFCGGYPEEGVIQQGRYPGNNGHIGEVEHVPIEGFSRDLDVKQGEIDHCAIGEAVDGITDGAADDQS